jgi:hypothetical protein
MNKPLKFSEVSGRRQQLIRACQDLNFGVVRQVRIKGAEPMLDSACLMGDERLDLEANPRPEIVLADFDLREEWQRLFARFENIQNGVVEQLEVRAGIPRRLIFEMHLPGVGQ